MDAAQEVCTMNFVLILNKKNKIILGHLLIYLWPFHSPPKKHSRRLDKSTWRASLSELAALMVTFSKKYKKTFFLNMAKSSL